MLEFRFFEPQPYVFLVDKLYPFWDSMPPLLSPVIWAH